MNAIVKRFPLRLDIRNGTVDMTHGSGGRAMAQLIDAVVVDQIIDADDWAHAKAHIDATVRGG